MMVLLFAALLAAGAPQEADTWTAVQSLAGEWAGEGTGAPGEATGGFTFAADLQQRVLVRRNWAEYPATREKPAFRHEDMMVVYRDPDKTVRAMYFDNEGNVIRYRVQASADGKRIVFLSDAVPGAPRFRLTNALTAAGRMKITFEIAPPGKPEEFKTYIEAAARRR
ncbi:MAG: hypothetical protein ACE15B_17090 [Bryobacteraceae bacterium]